MLGHPAELGSFLVQAAEPETSLIQFAELQSLQAHVAELKTVDQKKELGILVSLVVVGV